MNEPPPDGGAGRDGTTAQFDEEQSPAATATTTSTLQAPADAPRAATLKLRNDRGHVELSKDGFCKVRLGGCWLW